MRIIVDFTAFIPQSTGVDTYLKQLVLHLAKIDSANQYLICLNFEDRHLFAQKLPENFSCRILSARLRAIRLIYQQIALPITAFLWKADIIHSPAFIMPFIRGASQHILTIHDMTSFSHPHCHNALRRSSLYLSMVRASMVRADMIIVPSLATKKVILEFMPDLCPENIHVTPLGVSKGFRLYDRTQIQDTLKRLRISQPYILYVGTLEPRKNLPALIEAYRRLLQAGAIREDLVIAGKLGWDYDVLLQQIDMLALRGKVHLTGYLDQQDLGPVYSGARLFVYPSLIEGFGLPPLEAMACGTPTISTVSSSLSENLEGAAELIPPDNIEALEDTMKHLLNDEILWNKRRVQGLERASQYRWERTAMKTLASYQVTMTTAQRGWHRGTKN